MNITDIKRVFIAIEFEESLKNYLREIENKVVRESKSGNFSGKENFHLTLKFIGEIETSKIDEIKKCMDEVALKQNNFSLSIDKLGQFPRGNKSIVWVGLKHNETLNKLAFAMETSLESIGIEKENKKFTSHITLGRQVVFNESFSKLSENINIDSKTILVDKISLMESTRIAGELKYIPLYVKSFK